MVYGMIIWYLLYTYIVYIFQYRITCTYNLNESYFIYKLFCTETQSEFEIKKFKDMKSRLNKNKDKNMSKRMPVKGVNKVLKKS